MDDMPALLWLLQQSLGRSRPNPPLSNLPGGAMPGGAQ
jgi:hypothetical protein